MPSGIDPQNLNYNPLFDDVTPKNDLDVRVREKLSDVARPVVVIIPGLHALGGIARTIEARNLVPDQDPALVSAIMLRHYGPYEPQSTFYVVYDPASKYCLGSARYIEDGPNGLKTLQDLSTHWDKSADEAIEKHGIDVSSTLDIAAVAVEKSARQPRSKIRAEAILNHVLFRQAQALPEFKTWVTIVVESYFNRSIRRGMPFERILGLETRVHMEEPSVPAVMHLNRLLENMQTSKSFMHRLLIEGVGIEYDLVDLR